MTSYEWFCKLTEGEPAYEVRSKRRTGACKETKSIGKNLNRRIWKRMEYTWENGKNKARKKGSEFMKSASVNHCCSETSK